MRRIILIGNYQPDKQESMERFAQMLDAGFYKAGFYSEIWRPTVFLGKVAKNTSHGWGKWLGYIDKYIIFPVVLKARLKKLALRPDTLSFHICDHSNAIYLKRLPAQITSVTCHDVLAIKAGLGYEGTKVTASFFGKWLQKWILKSLVKSNKIAAVSNHTLSQLHDLMIAPANSEKDWRVIFNGFNAVFRVKDLNNTKVLLARAGLAYKTPYILHVGSDLQRKNRQLLLDMAFLMKETWDGYIYYAGKPINQELELHARSLGLWNKVVSVVNPDHLTLEALYTASEAFIFPSFSEGFGWPLIEAQACRTPVITSTVEPMIEVTGGSALYANPNNPQEFANAFLRLGNETVRNEVVNQGILNVNRFKSSKMIKEYIDLFGWAVKTTGNYAD